AQHMAHQPPELVVRIGVVLLLPERDLAGEAAEHQEPHARVRDRGERRLQRGRVAQARAAAAAAALARSPPRSLRPFGYFARYSATASSTVRKIAPRRFSSPISFSSMTSRWPRPITCGWK